jgi:PPOX class probable F420-dependent enzyme
MRPEVRSFLEGARVAHMATADAAGVPSVVPICFQVEGSRLLSVIDEKPKRTTAGGLKRIRNLRVNPRVAVVVDRYDEDWSRLGWVLLRGRAEVLEPGEAQRAGVALLREKYPQYRQMALGAAPLIRIEIETVRRWGNLGLR